MTDNVSISGLNEERLLPEGRGHRLKTERDVEGLRQPEHVEGRVSLATEGVGHVHARPSGIGHSNVQDVGPRLRPHVAWRCRRSVFVIVNCGLGFFCFGSLLWSVTIVTIIVEIIIITIVSYYRYGVDVLSPYLVCPFFSVCIY